MFWCCRVRAASAARRRRRLLWRTDGRISRPKWRPLPKSRWRYTPPWTRPTTNIDDDGIRTTNNALNNSLLYQCCTEPPSVKNQPTTNVFKWQQWQRRIRQRSNSGSRNKIGKRIPSWKKAAGCQFRWWNLMNLLIALSYYIKIIKCLCLCTYSNFFGIFFFFTCFTELFICHTWEYYY